MADNLNNKIVFYKRTFIYEDNNIAATVSDLLNS
jgi:hypothetical protein